MIEAMKQALEALENNRQTHHYCEDSWYSCPKHEDGCANDSEGDECNCGADKANAEIDSAITSLRQAIAEAEKQEPVGEVINDRGDVDYISYVPPIGTNLYTHPQPKREWVGLTDEEMRELEKQFNAERVRTSDEEYLVIYPADYWGWQRAIEAKLKEKNT
jgi:hypothetical protein